MSVPHDRLPTRFAYGRLYPVGALADQGQEFGARFFFVAEAAQHGGRYGGGMLLFYAAHHHAEMAGFDDHAYALRLDYFLNGFGDLRGEAFLNLQAAGEEFDQARDLAQADHLAVGDVGYVHFAEERQQVVLAEAEHFYVFDDDHLVVGDGEERAFEQGFGIFGVAAGEELQRLANALREFAGGLRVAGSSPRRTSISWTRSSKLALVRVGCSVEVFMRIYPIEFRLEQLSE